MPLAQRNHLGDSACSRISPWILTIVTCRRQTIRIPPSSPRRTSRRSSSCSSSPESPTAPGIRRLISRSASARWRASSGSKQPRSLRRRRCSSCRSARCHVSATTPCACGRRRSTSMRSRGSRSSRETSPRIASRLVPRSSGSRRSTPNRCDDGGTSSWRVCPRGCRGHARPRRRVARGRGRRGRRAVRRCRRVARQADSSRGADGVAARRRRRELQRRHDRPARSGRVAQHGHPGGSDHVLARDVIDDRRARARDGASPVGRGEYRERPDPAAGARVRRRRRAFARDAVVRNRSAHRLAAGLLGHTPRRGARGGACVHGHPACVVQGGAHDVRGHARSPSPSARSGDRCSGLRQGRSPRRSRSDSSAVCSRGGCTGRRSSSSFRGC